MLVFAFAVGPMVGCSRGAAPTPIGTASASARSTPPARPPSVEQGRCLVAEDTSKYTVVFVATASRVREIFVGWRQPVALRAKVQRNPFTGKEMSVQTTEPMDSDAGPGAREWDLRPGEIPRDGGYEGYLESRIPPEIRSLPHRPMKRILFAMMAIAETLVGKDEIPEALYPPSGCTTSLPLLRLPDAVATAVRGMNEEGATSLAARLAKNEAFGDWRTADIVSFLADLRALLRSASDGDGFYVLPV